MTAFEVDYRRSLLEQKRDRLISTINKWEHRYFHINTIGNFIFHFDEIKNENDKTWVYDNLNNFLDHCNEYVYGINRDLSKDIYYEHIDKLADYYDTYLGFSLITNKTLFILFYLVIFLSLWFIFSFSIGLLAVVFFVFRIFFLYKKYREKRVYSLFF